MRATLAVAALFAPLAAAAAPSFDCAAAVSDVERAICADESLAELDVELDRVYRAAEATQSGAALDRLRSDEAGWIVARDACGGTPDTLGTCVRDHYALRILDLVELDPATGDDAGTSLGPFLWSCVSIPDPVRAVFINVADALVALRWGNDAAVLPIAMSGSGARYATDGPQADEFWTKGNLGTFTPPGGASVDCTLAGPG